MADQTVISGVNFATAVILARYLSPTSYGYYALFFAILLLTIALNSALITFPMMVLAPGYEAHIRASYLSSLWVLQLAVSVSVSCVAGAVLLVDQWWGPGITLAFDIASPVLVLSTYLPQHFLRRVLFLLGDDLGGLGVDLVGYGLQFAVLVVLVLMETLTLRTVLWAMGLTSALGCVFGIVRARLGLYSIAWKQFGRISQLQWEQGAWLTSAVVAQWISRQFYLFVVAALLSPAATGMLAISRQLLGGINVLLEASENVVPSQLTRHLLSGGVRGMERGLGRFALITFPLAAGYCLIVAICSGPFMRFLFADKYDDATTVVSLVAIALFIMIITTTLMFALRAMRMPRWISLAYFGSAAATLAVSLLFIEERGLVGAAIGMIVIQIVELMIVIVGYRRARDSLSLSAPNRQQTSHGA